MTAETDWPALAAALGREGYRRQAFAQHSAGEVAFLVEHLGLGPGDVVADVGCGPGRHLDEWRRRDIRVAGFDASPAFSPPVLADALRLPLRGGSVTAAVALGVAPYVPLDQLLAELRRVACHAVAVSAFHAAFARRHLGMVGRRVVETARLPNGTAVVHAHDCHEPHELPGRVYGGFRDAPPTDDDPELVAVWGLRRSRPPVGPALAAAGATDLPRTAPAPGTGTPRAAAAASGRGRRRAGCAGA